MRIVKFHAENFARLKAVEIVPGDESVVTIHGENGAGKSSVLNAIAAVIDGGQQMAEPIRLGQPEAVVELELADKALAERLTVTRKYTRTTDAEGKEQIKQKLTVVWKEGGAGPRLSPQATLDALANGASFDPSEFLLLKPADQAERLRKLVNLDFTALDRKKDDLYVKRTEINRDGKAKRARFDAMPAPSGATRVEVTDLLAEQKRLLNVSADLTELKSKVVLREHELTDAQKATARAKQTVADLEEKLRLARELATTAEATEATKKRNLLAAEEEYAAMPDPTPELAALNEQITGAEANNAKVAADAARAALEADLETLRKESVRLSTEIENIEKDKARQLAEAKFPVPGLGFTATGVTLDGVPFEQASGAQKVRVAMAIGIATTAKLKVVRIHEASTFDAKNLALIAQMAAEAGAQVWMCRVENHGAGFEIEDGTIVSPAPAEAAPAEPPAAETTAKKKGKKKNGAEAGE